MLNANAAVFVPKPIAPPAPAAVTDSQTVLETTPAGETPAIEPARAATEASTDDYDADFEEVLNALEELQESQINQEVEEQLMQEMELYGTDNDEFDEEDEHLLEQRPPVPAGGWPSNYQPPPPPFPRQRSAGAPRCKFAPTCRDGSRRCRFSHQHMGACKFGDGCNNPTCNYIH